jgi:hypothetical protein
MTQEQLQEQNIKVQKESQFEAFKQQSKTTAILAAKSIQAPDGFTRTAAELVVDAELIYRWLICDEEIPMDSLLEK